MFYCHTPHRCRQDLIGASDMDHLRASYCNLVSVCVSEKPGSKSFALTILTTALILLIWYLNNVFELMSVEPIFSDHTEVVSRPSEGIEMANDRRRMTEAERSKFLSLKGQMIYMDEWESICFLGNPIVVNLKQMYGSGLYINDFALHDSSRDLVLTSTLQSAELKLLLDQEAQKGLKLQENTEMLKSAREKTDQLLYQLLPKSVADQLRKGVSAVATCESFDSVTILFTDIVGFTSICSNITPIAVVNFLNHMYSVFDALTAQHAVFKVETIGDAYMIVGGAPVKNIYHAEYVCDCALSIMKSVEKMIEATSKRPIQIRAGVHSGNVVAGVVGLQMPRYCLFGENVAVANRMESTGSPMKIKVSETTKKALDDLKLNSFIFSPSSPIDIGNQKQLKTFWLDCKNGPPRPPPLEDDGMEEENEIAFFNETDWMLKHRDYNFVALLIGKIIKCYFQSQHFIALFTIIKIDFPILSKAVFAETPTAVSIISKWMERSIDLLAAGKL
uniref:guanylate cyclase n=1 Tax=Romanomermis culicivorax TaxID=13658 RepID=A0A915KNT7_ROMCU